jgi:CDP-diacylglycerol--glycerol-3-phosphate 3-phosphatidyltransferase
MSVKHHIVTTITLLRVAFAILIILAARNKHWLGVLVLMLIAFVSDYIDGFLARRWKAVTSLGAFLDPFADKVLCLTVLALLAVYATALYWLPFVIFATYDIFTTTLRLMLARTQSMPASHVAKWKTATLMFGLIGAVISVAAKHTALGDVSDFVGTACLVIASVLTVISASGYLRLVGRLWTGGWLEHAESVRTIDFRQWHDEYGITTVLFDVEGTLTEWRGDTVSDPIIKALQDAKKAGIVHIGLVSNMPHKKHSRMEVIARQVGAETVHTPRLNNERKPSAAMIHAALNNLKTTPEHAGFVGDKLVDVVAGHRAGLPRVAWVAMLPGNDHPVDRLIYRRIERGLKWLTS